MLHAHQHHNTIMIKTLDFNVLKNAFSRVGVKTWNEIPYELKKLSKKSLNKKEFKKSLLEILKTEDSYIEFTEITRKLKQCKINKV